MSMLTTWHLRIHTYLRMHQGVHIILYCCVGFKIRVGMHRTTWISFDCTFYLSIMW